MRRRDQRTRALTEDVQKARVRLGEREALASITDVSTGGFGITISNDLNANVGDTLELKTAGGWCEVKVVHVRHESGVFRLGLERQFEDDTILWDPANIGGKPVHVTVCQMAERLKAISEPDDVETAERSPTAGVVALFLATAAVSAIALFPAVYPVTQRWSQRNATTAARGKEAPIPILVASEPETISSNDLSQQRMVAALPDPSETVVHQPVTQGETLNIQRSTAERPMAEGDLFADLLMPTNAPVDSGATWRGKPPEQAMESEPFWERPEAFPRAAKPERVVVSSQERQRAIQRGFEHFWSGDAERSAVAFEEAIAGGEDATVCYFLAMSYHLSGRQADADRWLARAVLLEGEREDATAVRLALARVQGGHRRWVEAARAIARQVVE